MPRVSHGPTRAGIAFGLAVAVFAAFQQFKLPVLLPVLLERYGYDRVVAGGFMSVFAISGLLLSLRVGRAIERGGATRPVLLALALLGAGTVLTLAAPAHQLVVLGARTLEGVGFTILAVAGPFLASANATPRQLPVVIGLAATWIPFGQLLATALAPAALASAGWQSLWWLGLAGAAVLAAWTLRIEAAGVRAAGSGDASRKGSSTLSARARITLILGAALFVLWSAQYIAFATWLPQYLVEARHLPLSTALHAYVISAAAVMAANVAAGFAMRAGVSLGAVLVLGLAAETVPWWVGHAARSDAAGVALLVMFSAGAGLVPTCLFGIPSALGARGGGAARAFATLMTGRNLGVLIGPVLLAQVVELRGDWSGVGAIFGTIAAAAVVLGALVGRRLRAPGAP